MTSIIVAALCVMAAPFAIFYCAKLATFGALCGRRRFEEKFPTASKENADGHQSKGA